MDRHRGYTDADKALMRLAPNCPCAEFPDCPVARFRAANPKEK